MYGSWHDVLLVPDVDEAVSEEYIDDAIDDVSPFNDAGKAFEWLMLEAIAIAVSLGIVTGVGWLIFANRRPYGERFRTVLSVGWQVLTRHWGFGAWLLVLIIVAVWGAAEWWWPWGAAHIYWLVLMGVGFGILCGLVLARWYRLLGPPDRGRPPPPILGRHLRED